MSQLLALPDELLGAIINQTDTATETARFGQVCKRLHDLEVVSPVWQRHCLTTWNFWHPRHELGTKLAQPPLLTDWRALYHERRVADQQALNTFELLLSNQRARAARINVLAEQDPDAHDLFLRVARNTPDEAEDVLARRWHANAVVRLMHRRRAIEVWSRLQRGEPVELEEALGAYDDFVLGTPCNSDIIKPHLDRHATKLVEEFPEFEHATMRRKAVLVAAYLQAHRVVGTSDTGNYHALRNNFLTPALANTRLEHWGSLPLQSVAIYCALARRLGIDAAPANFPHHVHAIVNAPADATLDGYSRSEDVHADATHNNELVMYMDPFNQAAEVPLHHLEGQLANMGVPQDLHRTFLGPATTVEMVLRTGRNIFVSAHTLRGQRMPQCDGCGDEYGNLELDVAKYAALWSLFILGDSEPMQAAVQRRQGIRHLLNHLRTEYPQDAALLFEMATRLLHGFPEFTLVETQLSVLQATDRHAKVAKHRLANGKAPVIHPVGTYFEHRNYGYQGFITGWDTQCAAALEWIQQMGVDALPRGRNQPFYNVIANDGSSRYVAEENITPLSNRPPAELMVLAGKYFKRWDDEGNKFVNNLLEEYPED